MQGLPLIITPITASLTHRKSLIAVVYLWQLLAQGAIKGSVRIRIHVVQDLYMERPVSIYLNVYNTNNNCSKQSENYFCQQI